MRKVENILLLSIVLILLSWIIGGIPADATMDIHAYDTLYVIGGLPVISFVVGIPLLLYFLYWVIRKRQGSIKRWVSLLHIIPTSLVIILLGMGIFFPSLLSALIPENSASEGWAYYNNFTAINKVVTVSMLLFLAMQVFFLIYFIIEMIRPQKPGKLAI
jgi:hypothetical protein